jgi:CzcA family heavy metal efflux pump
MNVRELLTRNANAHEAGAGDTQSLWFARNGKSILFLIIVMGCVGAYLAFTIPISVFPTTDFPRIIVGVDNGVMPIDQMMVTITRPLEEAVNSVPGLQQVRSTTSRGSAEVSLFFNWNVNMFQTLQLVDAALARVQPELPATAKIVSHRLTFATFPILGYSLTSNTVPQTQLWEMATYELKPRLNRLDGVATVVVQGGQEPEFHIVPDPAKLVRTSVTVTDILDAVQRTNLIASPGLIEQQHQLFLGLVSGQVQDPAQLGQIVIKTTPAGVPVRVGDVATVAAAIKPVYTVVTANGQPAVLLNINRQPDSNTLDVANEVHAEIASIQKSLPANVKLEPFYDQSTIVSESIASVRDAILIGLILATIIIIWFLRDWGSSLVAGLVIPVTVLITFIALKVLGESFNLMTLGGLAAAVGLVIDDAIVVVENIVLHRDAGQSRGQAIKSALGEITVPLVGSTLTPIVVFLPLISMTGVEGTFFRALAITMSIALLTSLALALTWTPTLSQYFIGARKNGEAEVDGLADEGHIQERLLAVEEASLDSRIKKVLQIYEHWLRVALEKPKWLAGLGAALVLVVAVLLYFRVIGTDLLPAMDEGGFVLDYTTPPGSSLAETNRMVTHLEQMLRAVPEVESTSRRTGMQLGLAAVTEANSGDIAVKLKAKRSRSVDEIIAGLRAQIAEQEPAIDADFTQVLQDMINDLTGAPQPIEIKLFSDEIGKIKTGSGDAAKGVVDVLNGVDNAMSGPAVTYQIDPSIASRAGFTPDEVATDAGALLGGDPVATPLVANDRAYTIRERFPEEARQSIESMSNTLLNSASGKLATLGTLATVTQQPGQTEIRRENLQRDVAVTARLEGMDLGSGIAAVQKAIAKLKLPSSIRVEYGGQYQEQQRSFHDLILVLLLAIVLVFVVLLFEFRSFAAPVAILCSALLSTSGVFLALLVTHTSFNLASFMGLIMVVGIVAKNGILLLDAEGKFRKAGLTLEDAMVQAGRRRLRPILMTAVAAMAGMLPLAFALGAGSQMLQPLAIAVIGGILISIALSLIITPVVHFYLVREPSPSSSS